MLDVNAILGERPRRREAGQRYELVLVPYRDRAVREVVGGNANPLEGALHLLIVGFGRPVGRDHTLVDEVMVIGDLAEAAPVGQDGMFRVTPVIEALVLPFPDRTADNGGVAVKHIAVLVKRTHGIEHGVGELTDVEGFRQVFCLRNPLEAGGGPVHLPIKVRGVLLPNTKPLVVHRAGRVKRLDRLHGIDEVWPDPAALVAERPDDDRGMVLEVLHVGDVAVNDRIAHQWLIIEPAIIAVALAIGLGD